MFTATLGPGSDNKFGSVVATCTGGLKLIRLQNLSWIVDWPSCEYVRPALEIHL